jgi:DNA/RNA-binding domain of Phe-tRNA-synthetase-like protein
VAVFDQATVNGSTMVRFATGEERFTDLGAKGTTSPSPGEVIFVDDDNIVSARRWCWRQSSQSATGPDTTIALITVEALHEDAEADIRSAVADLLTLLDRYQPQSDHSWRILSADNPVFTIGQ